MDAHANLTVSHLSCLRQHTVLFKPLSFQLFPHELLLIEGENGSGKSSLLRLLTGLASPHTGDIKWRNQSICSNGPRAYHNEMHYLGHKNGIKLGLSVSENLQLAHHLFLSPHTDYHDCLENLKLSSDKNTLAAHLSAGQKRRLALATLFLLAKPLWLLDEPLTSLDVDIQTIFIQQLVLHLTKGGMAVICSHHPISFTDHRLFEIKKLRLTPC